jgi:hypothetical protein
MYKYRIGYWFSVLGAVLAIAYFLAIIAVILFDSFPPHDPYQSIISVISLISVPILVFLWVVISECSNPEKRIFTHGSLALMIIFGGLTSINRYVSLTIIPQAVQLGKTTGLEWFQPYGWPSIMAAIEVLAWGFYLGLALLCLAPAFSSGMIEKTIFWTLILSGIFCLVATFGQVLNIALLNILGVLAWGPGLIILLSMLAKWFKVKEKHPEEVIYP